MTHKGGVPRHRDVGNSIRFIVISPGDRNDQARIFAWLPLSYIIVRVHAWHAFGSQIALSNCRWKEEPPWQKRQLFKNDGKPLRPRFQAGGGLKVALGEWGIGMRNECVLRGFDEAMGRRHRLEILLTVFSPHFGWIEAGLLIPPPPIDRLMILMWLFFYDDGISTRCWPRIIIPLGQDENTKTVAFLLSHCLALSSTSQTTVSVPGACFNW
jgi:hypothetical protein